MHEKAIKVCQIIYSLNIGGAELLLYTICKELINQFPEKYDFIIIASHETGSLKEAFEKIGIRVIELNLFGKRIFTQIWRVYKTLIREKPDIVHTHLFPPDKIGQSAAFLALIKNRISTVHNMEPNITWQEKIAILIVKYIALKEIAVSNSVKNNLVQRYGYKSDKIEVIYTAPSTGFTAKKPKHLSTPIKIINLANLKQSKGQSFLIPAALEMVKITDNFSIELFGDSKNEYSQALDAQILQNKLEKHILIKGKCASPSSILPNYDIMISMSLWEGFPLAIIEGMSAGIPLILSDIPPHRELLEGIDDISFVRHHSIKEIALIFRRLISEDAYYSYLSMKMIERAEAFSVQKMITRYNSFYRTLMKTVL